MPRSATSASVDELQKAIGSIDLTMATLPVSITTRTLPGCKSAHKLKIFISENIANSARTLGLKCKQKISFLTLLLARLCHGQHMRFRPK